MADAKQEGASLRAMTDQYKRELDDARPLRPSFALTPAPQPSPSSPNIGQAAPTSLSPTPVLPTASTQQAPAPSSVSTKPAAVSRAVKTDPSQPDDSWTGMIKTWVSSFWGWIFG
jgi:hypothetical protein